MCLRSWRADRDWRETLWHLAHDQARWCRQLFVFHAMRIDLDPHRPIARLSPRYWGSRHLTSPPSTSLLVCNLRESSNPGDASNLLNGVCITASLNRFPVRVGASLVNESSLSLLADRRHRPGVSPNFPLSSPAGLVISLFKRGPVDTESIQILRRRVNYAHAI